MDEWVKNTRRFMQEQGLKHYVVAQKVGYNKQQFSDLLNGRRTFTANDIAKICSVLNVTPNDLFGVKNNELPNWELESSSKN